MNYKYVIDISDIGVDYQDEGPWRCYGVDTYGNTFSELLDNATIYETDQDGGSLYDYPMGEAGKEITDAAWLCIQQDFERMINAKGK